MAFVTGALSVIVLSLTGLPAHAQQAPFASFSGAWSGGGHITLSSGSRERIQCRATYNVQTGGGDLQLALRCASDSYNVDFHANVMSSNGNLTGNWSEATRQMAGEFTGRVRGNRIEARVEGQTFAALLEMITHGDQQSISIRSPGSDVSDVAISLRRR